MLRTYVRRSAVCIAALSLAGCHKLAQVRVDPATSTLTAVDDSEQLKAQQLDSHGNPMDKTQPVTWASNSPDVATVDNTGKATAHKSGSAMIRATVGSVIGMGNLQVQIPAKIVAQDVTLPGTGQSQPLALQVMDDTGKPIPQLAASVKVVSADPTVASVDGSESNACRVNGVGFGTTKLTASIKDLTQNINVTVAAPPVTDLKVTQTSLKLKVGKTQRLTVTAMVAANPAPASLVSYATSNDKVATVDADGTVHGVSKGKATITVTATPMSATVPVDVKR